jgi:hypothetical protein
MEEEGIWSLGFIFSGLADWGFFLCVDEEKRKKKRRREGLGERKKKRLWPWRERKKKRRWSVGDTVGLDWVSRVRPRCVDFVGLAMSEWKKRGFGVRVLFFLFWLIGEKERRKGAGRRHRLSRRSGLGVACYGFFFC